MRLKRRGAVRGRVTLDDASVPLEGVNVGLRGTGYGSATGPDGAYVTTDVPAGT